MLQQLQHLQSSRERQIQLALQALKQDANLPVRRAARIFNVCYKTLGRRREGQPSQADRVPKTMNLTKLEEEVVVEYILDLDLRGFSPTYAAVRNMADRLLATRGAGQVGIH